MVSKTERLFSTAGVSQSNKTKFEFFSKINKILILTILRYYLEMTKFLLNFVHLKKLLGGLFKQDKFRIFFRGLTFTKNMIHPMHPIMLISHIDLTIRKQTIHT